MKEDKAAAAAKSSPEGRQGGSGSQEQPRMEIGTHEGRQGGSGITTISDFGLLGIFEK